MSSVDSIEIQTITMLCISLNRTPMETVTMLKELT